MSKKFILLASLVSVVLSASAGEISIEFNGGKPLNKALHSSGWTPRSYNRSMQTDDDTIKSMNMTYTRTHDWPIVNCGQRMVDYQYIFPLFHLDAKDPKNYYFKPTDHIMQLARNIGLKIFYRLGTSIEHTENVTHFNTVVPEDFDKTAEIFAATIRHYNKGWADGFNWDIEYWEIWNEPDIGPRMWYLPGPEGLDMAGMRKKFIKLFVTCLKRLKSEFPELKIGGPALGTMSIKYLRELLEACKKEGVKPDFLSWHYYGYNPKEMIATGDKVRKLCNELGFEGMEFILNEYHYLLSWEGIHSVNPTPAMVKKAKEGPMSINGIDSACFYLTALSLFQYSEFEQAYYYGCSHSGSWGYMDHNKMFNKPYYAAKMFGRICKEYSKVCGVKSEGSCTALALKNDDGSKASLLITDYRGNEQVITVNVSGLDNSKVKRVTARVLDETRDDCPCEVDWYNGELTIVKKDRNSAAFLVTFDFR